MADVRLLLALVTAGCGEPAPTAGHARFEAVVGPGATAEQIAAFCDVHPAPAQARTFTWPDLDGGPGPDDRGWTWVNLWATWCAPCIVEMPLVQDWPERLRREGAPVTVRFVSADASPEDVARFRAGRPGAPDTLRLAEPGALPAWMAAMGVQGAGALPIHLFVDPEDRVRCARLGGISASDYAVVREVLRGG